MSGRLQKARTWSDNAQQHNLGGGGAAAAAATAAAAAEKKRRRAERNKDLPPAYSSSSTAAATTINTLETHVTAAAITQHRQQHHPLDAGPEEEEGEEEEEDDDDDDEEEDEPAVVAPTFLQPRVAAVLGVSRPWHPVLFVLRLFSIVPSIYQGFPVAIRALLMLHALFARLEQAARPAPRAERAPVPVGNDKLLLTETMLALMWCGCSGYLSFYFTDCLMSRWLIHYTPSATALRLVAVSALNGYLQSWTLHLSGSAQDPFLLLPTWIVMTSTLTLVYHITYRKINIRKETSTSMSVFSMASYLSMVALLIQQHWDRSDWLELPFVALGFRLLEYGGEVLVQVAKYANITVEP